MTQPQVKTQARVQIYEGMNVETVKKNGSDGQKLMASIFDEDQDGVYSKEEAEEFNRYNFKTEDGKITLYRNEDDGSKEVTEIKYDNFEKDVLGNELYGWHFRNDKGELCSIGTIGGYAKAVIDMVKGKAHFEGLKNGNLYPYNIELTVNNSDVEMIHASKSKINLQNVKNEGLLRDSATKIETDGESIVDADSNSQIEVKPQEED